MLPPMSHDRCPSCGQSAVSTTEPGRGKCAACGARFFKYPEVLPALATCGIDAQLIQQAAQTQALETIVDPSTGDMLRSINIQGLTLHLSVNGQAIWLSAEDCRRVGLAPAPITALGAASFSGPSSGEDVMAALGLGSGPATAAPGPSGGGLDLDIGDRGVRPRAPTLDAEAAAMFEDMPPPPSPEILAAGPVTSESAFGNKPSRVSGGGVIGLLVKLAVVVGLVTGGWFGYQEVRARLVWPPVALAWGYTATFPSRPPPVSDTVDTSQGRFERIIWEGKDGLKLQALWLDVGFGHDQVAKDVIPSVAGANFVVDPSSETKSGPKAFAFHADTGETVGQGRAYYDDNGHGIVLMATGPNRSVVGQGGAETFPSSLDKGGATSGKSAGTE